MYRSKYICGFLAFASAVLAAIVAVLYYLGFTAVLADVMLGFITVFSAIALLLLLIFALRRPCCDNCDFSDSVCGYLPCFLFSSLGALILSLFTSIFVAGGSVEAAAASVPGVILLFFAVALFLMMLFTLAALVHGIIKANCPTCDCHCSCERR